MPLLSLKQFVVLSTMLLCSATSLLQAQLAYQGVLDGIYPIRLVIEESNPTATLSISSASTQIKFIGGCDLGDCKYRGVDTSLALVFERTAQSIEGRMQNGEGASKGFALEQVAIESPFATGCSNTFWLRSYEDADEKHQLTLATLPGKQVKGSFYLAELGTGFSVSGTLENGILNLSLEGSANKKVGTINGIIGNLNNAAGVAMILNLEGSETTIELALSEEMSLNCMEVEGRLDMVHPVLEGTAYSSLPSKLWKSMLSEQDGYAHAWFEPTLFNAYMLSGWMHLEGPSGRTSKSINLLRDKKHSFKQGKLLGSKRSKNELTERYKERAIAQHPLHADEDFQDWAKDLDFSEHTFTTEGMTLSSERDPVYGQLQVIVPWRELPKNEALPTWLTHSN